MSKRLLQKNISPYILGYMKFCFWPLLLSILLNSSNLFAQKLLIINDAPYVLDKQEWKNYFQSKSWKTEEILEADKDHLFIYLNSYRIPPGMQWKKPSWGLWNIHKNNFLPLTMIPSNLIPMRIVGERIFIRDKMATKFYFLDLPENKIHPIKSSGNIKAWFPKADGSIVYVLNSSNCGDFQIKPTKDSPWSLCTMNSEFDSIEDVRTIPEIYNPMVTGNSDNFLIYWTKSPEEKLWTLESINLDTKELKILAKSNREDISQNNPPKWFSWIEMNWVAYEKIKNPETNGSEKTRSFIIHNLKSDQRKEVQLEMQGRILLEPGSRGKRQYQYRPYMVILNYTEEKKSVQVIEIPELKIVFETVFPLDLSKDKSEMGAFFPK